MGTVVRTRALISGRVQGVWYRDSCRSEARRLGLAGWVRNLPDGRVEVVAQGQPDAVEALLDWCAIGPPGAVVAGVEVVDPAEDGVLPRPFEIR